MPSASRTPWDGLPESEITPAQALVTRAHRDAYAARHAPTGADACLLNSYERGACPRCGSGSIRRHGADARGAVRWLCRACGRTFTPATGTIFEGHKVPVSDWCEFVIQLPSFDSMREIGRSNRRSPTTPPGWLAKLFLVPDGIRDGTALSGRVQIDETFWPLPGAERERNADVSLKRGLSRSRLCIAAATDGRGRAAVEPCGLGKPSGPRVLAAHSRHIARGSVLVHDKEKSHRALVGALGFVSEAHDSRAVRRLPDRDSPLADVNRLHFPLKRFQAAHAGFDRAGLKGWLDLFSVIANPPSGVMEKAAMVMERAMARLGTLRFREFYGGCRS